MALKYYTSTSGGWITEYVHTIPAADIDFILYNVGEYIDYTLGPNGESSVTLLSRELNLYFYETMRTYFMHGEINPAEMTFDGKLGILATQFQQTPPATWPDATGAMKLFWPFGEDDIIVSEASEDDKITIAGIETNTETFNMFQGEGWELAAASTSFGRADSPTFIMIQDKDLNLIAYSEKEVSNLIERFGASISTFASRRLAMKEMIEDVMNERTSGISTLSYDTQFINHEISNNPMISNSEVDSITSPEAGAASGRNFSTAITTTTSTAATGTTSTSTSATTTGTSGY